MLQQGSCDVSTMQMRCRDNVAAMSRQCILRCNCNKAAAMSRQERCDVATMKLRCHDKASAMLQQSIGDVAMQMQWMSRHTVAMSQQCRCSECRDNTVAMSRQCSCDVATIQLRCRDNTAAFSRQCRCDNALVCYLLNKSPLWNCAVSNDLFSSFI